MKSSSSRHFWQLVSLSCLLITSLPTAWAQDELVLENGQRRQGEVVGVSGGNVTLKVGPVQSTVPLAQVKSARVALPAELTAAESARASGNTAQALAGLRNVVTRYGGLPIDWVERAYVMLGESQIELGQTEEAGKTFSDFTRLYPDAGGLAAVSMASLDVSKGDFAAAESKLTPLISEAAKVQLAEPAQSAAYGRAFLLMGRVREEDGDFPEALQNYLRTVTVFYADATAVAEARRRAEALINEKNVIAP